MASPGASCPNCVSEGARMQPAQVRNLCCSLSSRTDAQEARRRRKELAGELRQQVTAGRGSGANGGGRGSEWAEAWQSAKRIKYGGRTKAVSQGRRSHTPPPSRTSNLLLPRQQPATKTAPDSTKNKTTDRCRYCHAERSLLPSSHPPPPPPPRAEEKNNLRPQKGAKQVGSKLCF